MKYFVYLLRCSDDTLYCGITQNLERRILEHNQINKKASKYIIPRRPCKLVYYENCKDRSEATIREHEIKKMSKPQKESLIDDKFKFGL